MPIRHRSPRWLLGPLFALAVTAARRGFLAQGDGVPRWSSARCCRRMTPSRKTSGLLRRTYEFTAEAINRSGGIRIGGKAAPVRLEILQDGAPPEVLARAYGRMADDGVRIFLGPFGEELAQAAVRAARERGLLLVLPGPSRTAGGEAATTVFSTLPVAGELPGHCSTTSPPPASVRRGSASSTPRKPSAGAWPMPWPVRWPVTGASAWSAFHSRQAFPMSRLSCSRSGSRCPTWSCSSAAGRKTPSLPVGSGPWPDRRPSCAPWAACRPATSRRTRRERLDGILVLDFWDGRRRPGDEDPGPAGAFVREFRKKFGYDPDYHVAAAAMALLVIQRGIEAAGDTRADRVAEIDRRDRHRPRLLAGGVLPGRPDARGGLRWDCPPEQG